MRAEFAGVVVEIRAPSEPGLRRVRPFETAAPAEHVFEFLREPPRGRIDSVLEGIDLRYEPGVTTAYSPLDADLSMSIVLRAAVAHLLASRGILMVHAAAVRGPQGVVLAPAPSGTGKTTFALRHEPSRILGDDLVAVVKDPQQGFWVHSLPFASYHSGLTPRPDRGRLALVAFLEQSPRPELVTVSPSEAVLRLCRNVVDPQGQAHEIVHVAAAVAARVRCVRLGLDLTTPFWHLLDASVQEAYA